MKILFFSRLFWPHVGGVEKHVEKVSLELIKLGHQVTIITEQYDKKLKLVEKRKSVTIHRIPVWDISEKAKKWKIWQWLWQHRSLITQVDILHIHDVFFWYLPFKLLRPSKKVFITFHGYETKFPPSRSAIWQKRLAAALTAGNICVGDYIGKWYGIKPTLVTYGATDQKLLPWPKKPAVIILGRPSPDNNIDEVRTALRYSGAPVATQLKQATVVIASSYLSIWEGLAAGRPVLSIYTNSLKKDYLMPLSKYIHIASSTTELVRLIRKYTPGVYLGKSWANLPTWDKITETYLNLWQK
jgi:glycosyltransferase involved in cell wall biosynthesis